jgi:hypothetical protein
MAIRATKAMTIETIILTAEKLANEYGLDEVAVELRRAARSAQAHREEMTELPIEVHIQLDHLQAAYSAVRGSET